MKTTTYLLEQPTSGTLTTPNADTDAEQQKLSRTADENAKWHSRFGRGWGFLQN